MAIKFNNCTFKNTWSIVKSDADIEIVFTNNTVQNIMNFGFEVTQNTDIYLQNSSFSDVKGGVIKIKKNEFLEKIGLDQDTDLEELKSLLLKLKSSPLDQHKSLLDHSFLSNTANFTTVAVNIIALLPYINLN